jgi:hypothetical protein
MDRRPLGQDFAVERRLALGGRRVMATRQIKPADPDTILRGEFPKPTGLTAYALAEARQGTNQDIELALLCITEIPSEAATVWVRIDEFAWHGLPAQF